MPHRDPETGRFISTDGDEFNDIEQVTFTAGVGIGAGSLAGGTGFVGGTQEQFDGLELIDYDEIVDRNEELHLLRASHSLVAYVNSTETADGTIGVAAEVSAAPSLSAAANIVTATNVVDSPVTGAAFEDDTIDVIGRVLQAVGHAPFSDGTTGVGGAGSAGEDREVVEGIPDPIARFHPRDELFLNGEFVAWNIDDAGIHLSFQGQHVYGVATQ